MKTLLKKVMEGLSFSTVVSALGGGMTNICSYMEQERLKFLEANNLKQGEYLLMANHSVGGRKWHLVEGRPKAPFLPEPDFNGGWYAFTEADVDYLFLCSAMSGSSLTAEKKNDGTWTVTLEVPVNDDGPYEGCYWKTFHAALSE